MEGPGSEPFLNTPQRDGAHEAPKSFWGRRDRPSPTHREERVPTAGTNDRRERWTAAREGTDLRRGGAFHCILERRGSPTSWQNGVRKGGEGRRRQRERGVAKFIEILYRIWEGGTTSQIPASCEVRKRKRTILVREN